MTELTTGLDTREKILEAAEKLFAQKGYAGVTVREITARAGVHLAAVNYHFRSKKDLYLDVFQSRWLPRAQILKKPLGDLLEEPDLTLDRIVKTMVTLFLFNPLTDEERRRHGQLIAREMAEPGEAFELVIDKHLRPTIALLEGLLARAIDRPVDSDRLKLSVFSILAQGVYFSMAGQAVRRVMGETDRPDFVDLIVSHVSQFALTGLEGLART